jgi:hypothetical protein
MIIWNVEPHVWFQMCLSTRVVAHNSRYIAATQTTQKTQLYYLHASVGFPTGLLHSQFIGALAAAY